MLISPERTPSRVAGIPRLSKSRFLSGLQCLKRLYLEAYSKELATQPDEQSQAILDMGTAIGELARCLFPNGVLVEADYRHPTDALKRTAELLADPSVPAIFEGAFEYDGVLVRVDILERDRTALESPPAWRLIEVKSSTRVKDVHIEDLAIQTYVLAGAGLAISGSCLMHINNQYLYPGGELDLAQLFACRNLTAQAAAKQSGIAIRLAGMKGVLAEPIAPEVEPDGHCHQPYDCPFWDHCTKDKPLRWIYHLPGSDKTFHALTKLGIRTMDDIPATFNLTILQRRVKEHVEWIHPKLAGTLKTVRYPVHHLDMETFMPAIPKFPMTRPYQTIPFQWSNHVESEDGSLRHDEFLCQDARDPREELAVALLESLGKEGSICVYSDYERHILENLAQALPTLRHDLTLVMDRLWDLLHVIREHYYHPAFYGSFSIKSVLPALVPAMSYEDLEIQEGGLAAHFYYRMAFEESDWVEQIRLRTALLKYCARDTLAMVELRKVLLGKSPVTEHDAR